jgi:hypothetical protein
MGFDAESERFPSTVNRPATSDTDVGFTIADGCREGNDDNAGNEGNAGNDDNNDAVPPRERRNRKPPLTIS